MKRECVALGCDHISLERSIFCAHHQMIMMMMYTNTLRDPPLLFGPGKKIDSFVRATAVKTWDEHITEANKIRAHALGVKL